MSYQKFGVIGGGAWGTALAQSLCLAGRDVQIWALEQDVVEDINLNHVNSRYLPGFNLNGDLSATISLEELVGRSDALLLVTPAQYVGATMASVIKNIQENIPIIICSKGIEIESGRLLSQVLLGLEPNLIVGALSGPGFASEVVQGKPTAVTIAFEERYHAIGYDICQSISHPTLRPYFIDDIVGVQVGGALKNVVAIACGIAEGRNLGLNARAAIITRGLAEIVRFGQSFGAQPSTFMGLSGLGDLCLTCNAMESRNFSFGCALGQGKTAEEIIQSRGSVTEGAHTVKAVLKIAEERGIDMPIARSVYEAMNNQKTLDHLIKGLLERPLGQDVL